MAIKIDFEKAYDRLNWNFLHETLIGIGLHSWFVEVIMACVSTSEMRILWNGEMIDPFNPSRGVRQGDSLSPYLFVLCMERLSCLINSVVEDKTWLPIRLSKNGPHISHLFFADDLILFAEANLDQVEVINNVLSLFCQASGQRVNADKTRVFFSSNINHNRATQLSEELGFTRTSGLGKYLGAPIHHGRVSKKSYKFIIDKVQKRLSSWKANTLNLTGRAVLVNSVLHAIPSYSMQTATIPVSVHNEVEKISRNFLWGSNGGHNRMHILAWDRVCTPKSQGGLGFRSLRSNNEAHMMKLAWQLTKNKEKLWVQVVQSKYNCGNDVVPNVMRKGNSSNVWRGIAIVWNKFLDGLIWRVGNGRSIRFWQDPWLTSHYTLENSINLELSISERESRLIDKVVYNVGWDETKIRLLLPNEISDSILSLIPPCDDAGQDTLAWRYSSNGTFDIKSAYEYLTPSSNSSSDRVWHFLWK